MISTQDKKYLTEAGKIILFEAIKKNKKIRKRLPVLEYINLQNEINNLHYEDIVEIFVNESIRDFESKFGKFVKYGFASVAGAALGVGLAPVAVYLYRKTTDSCVVTCIKKTPLSIQKNICKYKCQLDSARKIATDLRSEISKCSSMRDPDKCRQKLQVEYAKWVQRIKQLIIKYNQANAGVAQKRAKEKKQGQE